MLHGGCPVPVRQEDALTGSNSLYRLKVINIPDNLSEQALVELFSSCGTVYEARIVHDKVSGLPVGYGYVSYSTKEDADRAISKFDDQMQLGGAGGRLSVYYAKKQHSLKESSPARNAKLYFCGTPPGCKRETIVSMFSVYGRVRHLQVYMDSTGTLSSGTVTMFTAGEAVAAMMALDGAVPAEGTAPLKVTWAQLTTTKRLGVPSGGKYGFNLVYSNVPPIVAPADLIPAFESFGTVLQVIPFAQRREGPRNCRGCGLVVMATEGEAMAAVAGLHGVTKWPGAERALSVQPYVSCNDRTGAAGPLLPGRVMQGPNAAMFLTPAGGQVPMANSGCGGGMAAAAPLGLPAQLLGASRAPGGAGDVFELMVANLPAAWTEQDLLHLLRPYGMVAQLQLARDPNTGVSLGYASVLYHDGRAGAAAVTALNGVLVAGHAGDAPRVLLVQPTASLSAAGGGPAVTPMQLQTVYQVGAAAGLVTAGMPALQTHTSAAGTGGVSQDWLPMQLGGQGGGRLGAQQPQLNPWGPIAAGSQAASGHGGFQLFGQLLQPGMYGGAVSEALAVSAAAVSAAQQPGASQALAHLLAAPMPSAVVAAASDGTATTSEGIPYVMAVAGAGSAGW